MSNHSAKNKRKRPEEEVQVQRLGYQPEISTASSRTAIVQPTTKPSSINGRLRVPIKVPTVEDYKTYPGRRFEYRRIQHALLQNVNSGIAAMLESIKLKLVPDAVSYDLVKYLEQVQIPTGYNLDEIQPEIAYLAHILGLYTSQAHGKVYGLGVVLSNSDCVVEAPGAAPDIPMPLVWIYQHEVETEELNGCLRLYSGT